MCDVSLTIYQDTFDLFIIEKSKKILIVPFQLVKELEELQFLQQKIKRTDMCVVSLTKVIVELASL